jgi:hypothetical protein
VSTLPFTLCLGTPASLQSNLDRTVADVGAVTIEQPPKEQKGKVCEEEILWMFVM